MFKLLKSIGLALVVADLKRRIRYVVRSGILGLIGALVAIIALCFFLAAAHLYLSSLLNPIASAAIIGGVLLAIALILFFIASRPMSKSVPKPAEREPTAGVGDAIREGVAKFGEAAAASNSPLRNPVVQTAGMALIAGFLLGRRSKRDKD